MPAADLPRQLREVVADLSLPPLFHASSDWWVVMPTYRAAGTTRHTLQTLFAAHPHRALSVLVVDNGGHDSPALRPALGDLACRVGLAVTRSNLGCSGAMALGLLLGMEHGAQKFCLADNDAVGATPAWLDRLEQALDTWDMVCPSHPHFTGRRLTAFEPSLGLPFHYLCFRRAVPEKIGLVDPEFFLGMDDYDFVLRARCSGFRAAAVPDVSYHHPSFRPSLFSPAAVYRTLVNSRRILARRSITLVDRFKIMIHAMAYTAVKLLHSAALQDTSLATAVVAGWWDEIGTRRPEGLGPGRISYRTSTDTPTACDAAAWWSRLWPARVYRDRDSTGAEIFWERA